jgi:hypothetical protein
MPLPENVWLQAVAAPEAELVLMPLTCAIAAAAQCVVSPGRSVSVRATTCYTTSNARHASQRKGTGEQGRVAVLGADQRQRHECRSRLFRDFGGKYTRPRRRSALIRAVDDGWEVVATEPEFQQFAVIEGAQLANELAAALPFSAPGWYF